MKEQSAKKIIGLILVALPFSVFCVLYIPKMGWQFFVQLVIALLFIASTIVGIYLLIFDD